MLARKLASEFIFNQIDTLGGEGRGRERGEDLKRTNFYIKCSIYE